MFTPHKPALVQRDHWSVNFFINFANFACIILLHFIFQVHFPSMTTRIWLRKIIINHWGRKPSCRKRKINEFSANDFWNIGRVNYVYGRRNQKMLDYSRNLREQQVDHMQSACRIHNPRTNLRAGRLWMDPKRHLVVQRKLCKV